MEYDNSSPTTSQEKFTRMSFKEVRFHLPYLLFPLRKIIVITLPFKTSMILARTLVALKKISFVNIYSMT